MNEDTDLLVVEMGTAKTVHMSILFWTISIN